jgi:hypothetical protein
MILIPKTFIIMIKEEQWIPFKVIENFMVKVSDESGTPEGRCRKL